MFPAQALAEALTARGWRIVLATDERGDKYAHDFPAEHRSPLSAATFRKGDVMGAIGAGWTIVQGVMQARTAFKVLDPAIVVGFGGYPSLPALLAALSTKRPTVIHEQNAVLGRVNRFLADKVDAVAVDDRIATEPKHDRSPAPEREDVGAALKIAPADRTPVHDLRKAILAEASARAGLEVDDARDRARRGIARIAAEFGAAVQLGHAAACHEHEGQTGESDAKHGPLVPAAARVDKPRRRCVDQG
jgi:UDP-N-acetylglucosamine:LPS N-acetylglucosamine transferase